MVHFIWWSGKTLVAFTIDDDTVHGHFFTAISLITEQQKS